MADKSSKPRPGVRGPGGPPAAGSRRTPAQASDSRRSLENASRPLLLALRRVPVWLVVILMATFLFLGLVVPVPWISAAMLLLVGVFLGWLLVLSWPVLGPLARSLRLITVAAILVIAVLRGLGLW